MFNVLNYVEKVNLQVLNLENNCSNSKKIACKKYMGMLKQKHILNQTVNFSCQHELV